MKSKFVVFRILAAIVAVAGAVASVSASSAFVITSAYVNYTTTNVPGRIQSYCTRVGNLCESTGLQPCTIAVSWTGATAVNYAAKENTCDVLIKHTNQAAVSTKFIDKENVVLQ
jgi:hypothetical protein